MLVVLVESLGEDGISQVCGVTSAGWLPLYIVPVFLAGAYHAGTIEGPRTTAVYSISTRIWIAYLRFLSCFFVRFVVVLCILLFPKTSAVCLYTSAGEVSVLSRSFGSCVSDTWFAWVLQIPLEKTYTPMTLLHATSYLAVSGNRTISRARV